jgi:hypothetical protein
MNIPNDYEDFVSWAAGHICIGIGRGDFKGAVNQVLLAHEMKIKNKWGEEK